MKENKQYYKNKGITTIMLNRFCRKIKEKYGDSVEIEDLKDYYDTTLSLKENLQVFEENFRISTDEYDVNADLLEVYDQYPELKKKATILNFLEKVVKNPSWHFSYKIKIENIEKAIKTSRNPKRNFKLFKEVKKRFYDKNLSKDFIFISCQDFYKLLGGKMKIQYWYNGIMLGLVNEKDKKEIIENARKNGLKVFDHGNYFCVED